VRILRFYDDTRVFAAVKGIAACESRFAAIRSSYGTIGSCYGTIGSGYGTIGSSYGAIGSGYGAIGSGLVSVLHCHAVFGGDHAVVERNSEIIGRCYEVVSAAGNATRRRNQTSRLKDIDFGLDQRLRDEGGEVGHYFFDLWAAAGEACDAGRAGEDERGDLFGKAFNVGFVLTANADS